MNSKSKRRIKSKKNSKPASIRKSDNSGVRNSRSGNSSPVCYLGKEKFRPGFEDISEDQ